MLCFYASIVGFLLLVELSCGVLAFLFRKKVEERILEFGREKLSTAIVLYRDPDKPDLKHFIETTQTEFKCCGIDSYEDWQWNIYFNCSSPGVEACGVPKTCCKKEEDRTKLNSQCGFGVGRMDAFEREKRIYTIGCLTAVEERFKPFKSSLITIGIASFSILFLQIISIWLATLLRRRVLAIKVSIGNPPNRR